MEKNEFFNDENQNILDIIKNVQDADVENIIDESINFVKKNYDYSDFMSIIVNICGFIEICVQFFSDKNINEYLILATCLITIMIQLYEIIEKHNEYKIIKKLYQEKEVLEERCRLLQTQNTEEEEEIKTLKYESEHTTWNKNNLSKIDDNYDKNELLKQLEIEKNINFSDLESDAEEVHIDI